MNWYKYIIIALISYFIGNISNARIISKLKHGDVTKEGSGNPGTLNMFRAFGLWCGVTTFILDAIKGLVPTLVAYLLAKQFGYNAEIALYVAGFSVTLGHIFPAIYKFKGGKGIATSIGVFLVANWKVALIVFIAMVLLILFVKYASVMTIGFVLVMSIVEIVLCNPINWINYILIAGISTLVLYAHRMNIVRIFHKKENKTELLAMIKKAFGKKTKTVDTEEVK